MLLLYSLLLECAAAGIYICDEAGAASTSRRAVIFCFTYPPFMIIPPLILFYSLRIVKEEINHRIMLAKNEPGFSLLQLRGAKIPESEYTTLPNGLKLVIS